MDDFEYNAAAGVFVRKKPICDGFCRGCINFKAWESREFEGEGWCRKYRKCVTTQELEL